MIIRYVVLSPSEEARQALLGGLFGTFELAPKGRGEKVTLTVQGGGLEIVGTGKRGQMEETARRLLDRGVQVDGILALIPGGDEASLDEARSISRWIRSGDLPVIFKVWSFQTLEDLEKETARRTLLTFIKEHEDLIAS